MISVTSFQNGEELTRRKVAKNSVEISVRNELESMTRAMRRVTSAIFAGSPGVAGTIKGKRRTAQVTTQIRGGKDKSNIQGQVRRHILEDVFRNRAPQIEREVKLALESVIMGLVGVGSPNVKVMGRSLGPAKASREIEQEPFARFVLSPEGAGEIGLPDPPESLRQLKLALLASITVDVIVHGQGPFVEFRFDQSRLLKLTPHPKRFEGGTAPFFSWLSLVTGPDFAIGGTPGYGLVRMSDFKSQLNKLSSRVSTFKGKAAQSRGLKRISRLQGMFDASRSLQYAGDMAGLMLSVIPGKTGRAKAEVLGGVTEQYRPDRRFVGFWDSYWVKLKAQLLSWTRQVIMAMMRALLRGA